LGALTFKTVALTGRPWEYQGVRLVSPFDLISSLVRADVFGFENMRVLPFYC